MIGFFLNLCKHAIFFVFFFSHLVCSPIIILFFAQSQFNFKFFFLLSFLFLSLHFLHCHSFFCCFLKFAFLPIVSTNVQQSQRRNTKKNWAIYPNSKGNSTVKFTTFCTFVRQNWHLLKKYKTTQKKKWIKPNTMRCCVWELSFTLTQPYIAFPKCAANCLKAGNHTLHSFKVKKKKKHWNLRIFNFVLFIFCKFGFNLITKVLRRR